MTPFKINLLQWQKDVIVVFFAILLGIGAHFLIGNVSLVKVAKNLQWDPYLVGFAITFIGNASILFPVAYAFVIPFLAVSLVGFWKALILGVVCGIAGGIGEMTAYGLGYLTGRRMSEKTLQNLRYLEERAGRSKPFLIFLVGLMPIPDEFVVVPLASAGYSFRKMVFFCTLGKIFLCIILSYAGLAWRWGTGNVIGSSEVPFSVIIPSFLLLFYSFIRIDWTKVLS
ncbi:MAG: VTT domain-containing protein [Candidatus Korarchaeota archaeon]|nr:VTT domain-containing protein [Candidatus Korarchaeota archaeon]NIU83073.1 hypothetical protein [Candidatus Thorarchaeota archaeon]NIW12617.1 hypothetical protein [Candidatus Thorarchaeota archaeon]NIW50828.1 hypothetical protein [Candidatus Korarchaeota archaeon]